MFRRPAVSATRAARAVRGLWPDRNPLRRTMDRVEAMVAGGLVIAFLAGGPLAAVAAGHAVYSAGSRTAHAQQATWRQVPAVLLAAAPPAGFRQDQVTVPARWTGPDGTRHTGTVPVPAGTRAGHPVMVWVDAAGRAHRPSARLAAAVYGVASVALFGVSAAYHRSPLGSRRRGLLARLDHMSILLLIAGTYTPLVVLALRGWTQLSLLAVIWGGAPAGILARLIWRPTWRPVPRWLITSLFIALGWAALFVLPQLLRGAGALVLALILAGGILYSLGAVVYAWKRPDPSPRWFGFHEVFHAATILAYLTQYTAVSLVVYRAA